MSDFHAGIERSQCSRGRSRSVAVNKNDIGAILGKDIAHARQHSRRHIVEILTRTHNIEVVIRLYTEHLQDTVEHLTVLSCDSYRNVKLAVGSL